MAKTAAPKKAEEPAPKSPPSSPTPSPTKESPHRSLIERIRKPSSTIGYVGATIFGKGGSGKTSLLATMPGKGLVLDVPQIEGGTMVLADESDRIDVLQIVKWSELTDVEHFLEDKSAHSYQWVAIDTVSAMQELGKRQVHSERPLGADQHSTSMQDWGKIGNLNGEFYFRFRRLPLHVIFLAQEQLKGGGEEGTLEYQPAVSPASLAMLTPSMFLVGRLYTKEVPQEDGTLTIERRLRVGPHERTRTKVRALRSRPLPSVIRDPNLGQIFGWVTGTKGVKQPQEVVEEAQVLLTLS